MTETLQLLNAYVVCWELNMSKYRIVSIEKENNTFYRVEKKFLFFWYNPLNINEYITGYFDKFIDAKKAIESLKFKTVITVVHEEKDNELGK